MLKLDKAVKALREGGISTLLKRSYLFSLIKILPADTVKYNGIKVKEGKKLDFLLPGDQFSEKPNYERGMSNALERTLEEDDKVVIIGGGHGVTAVKAKRIVGEKGEVIVYEAAEEMVKKIEKTAKINDTKIDEVNHASVGELKNPWGDASESKSIDVSELPECDVLEMDCEGAEIGILEELKIRPRHLIVESHGNQNSPTEEVENKIKNLDYKILDRSPAKNAEHANKKRYLHCNSKQGEMMYK